MSSQLPSSPTNPISNMLRSQIINSPDFKQEKLVQNSNFPEARQRSVLWALDMTDQDRRKLFNKLVVNWPYAKEKYAMLAPEAASIISVIVPSTIVTWKIVADYNLYIPKAGLLQTFRDGPKLPFILSIFATSIFYDMFFDLFVEKPLLVEDKPCASCNLSRMSALLIGSGVLIPAAVTPFIAHYAYKQKNPNTPPTKNLLDYGRIFVTASKPSWKYLPFLAICQFVVASFFTYSLLWGRQRVIDTLEIQPELINELTSEEKSFFNKILSKLSPF